LRSERRLRREAEIKRSPSYRILRVQREPLRTCRGPIPLRGTAWPQAMHAQPAPPV